MKEKVGGREGEGPEHTQPIGFGQVWPALFQKESGHRINRARQSDICHSLKPNQQSCGGSSRSSVGVGVGVGQERRREEERRGGGEDGGEEREERDCDYHKSIGLAIE